MLILFVIDELLLFGKLDKPVENTCARVLETYAYKSFLFIYLLKYLVTVPLKVLNTIKNIFSYISKNNVNNSF